MLLRARISARCEAARAVKRSAHVGSSRPKPFAERERTSRADPHHAWGGSRTPKSELDADAPVVQIAGAQRRDAEAAQPGERARAPPPTQARGEADERGHRVAAGPIRPGCDRDHVLRAANLDANTSSLHSRRGPAELRLTRAAAG